VARADFLFALTPLSLIFTASAAAQTLRDYDYARPLRNEHQLRAVVEFGAGRLLVRPGPEGRLYGMVLKYDAERFEPIGSYNPATAEVRLGVASHGGGGIRVNRERALPQVAVVEFPAGVDLSLDVTVGAAEATLNLGGLRIADLDLQSGASKTTISFDAVNAGSCRTAQLTSGAGELTITSAGNSGCRSWRFDGGVGAVTVDLGGAWAADARMDLNMALGGVTLQAPKDLGIRVRVLGFLSGFDAKGFSKDGKTYTSANYGSARHKVDIEVTSALGGVNVEWR
jgi:hypothetical protein